MTEIRLFADGAAIEKTGWRPGDLHADGACATVLGCLGPAPHPLETPEGPCDHGYWVLWEETGCTSFIMGNRVRAAGQRTETAKAGAAA